MIRKGYITVYLRAFMLATGLFSAGASGETTDSEARLIERAEAYWDAAKARDLFTLYEMEAAAKKGSLSPDQAKAALGTAKLLSYEILKIAQGQKNATILIKARYTFPGIKSSFTTERSDRWILLDGDWYHAQAGTKKAANGKSQDRD